MYRLLCDTCTNEHTDNKTFTFQFHQPSHIEQTGLDCDHKSVTVCVHTTADTLKTLSSYTYESLSVYGAVQLKLGP